MSDPTGMETVSDETADAPAIDPHADKYNDPRVKITWQGIAALVAIVIGGAVFALASVHARRTRLGQTTEFWGETTIRAIQLGDRVHLINRDDETIEVELTAMPGLGHLRRALLDERHYEWSTLSDQSVAAACQNLPDDDDRDSVDPDVRCVRLRFADPTYNRFHDIVLDIDLASGFVGPDDGSKRVQVNDRMRPALRHQLTLLMNFQQKRADDR